MKGTAGLAVLDSLDKQYEESQRRIAVDLKLAMEQLPRPRQLDPVMEGLIRETIGRNRKHLGDKMKKDFEDLFRETGSDDSVPLIAE